LLDRSWTAGLGQPSAHWATGPMGTRTKGPEPLVLAGLWDVPETGTSLDLNIMDVEI